MITSTQDERFGTIGPDRWQRLKAVLAEALERDSPQDRSATVKKLCADDTALSAEAESLLREAEGLLRDRHDPIEECASNAGEAIPREDLSAVGKRIGAYVVIREIGRGGMGTVYLAARADGYFEKQVAVKVLNRSTNNEEVVGRFRAEREVLARLDHPNIARLIDAGTTEDGLPYFMMEYVEGVPVTRFVESNDEPIERRLRLFLKICAAVEAAHRCSIVHRDLKSTNILVTPEGEPKLLDFGIAKLIGSATNPLEITAFGRERLTPISASPEQVRGETITVSSDIYALGVVLYEMLTAVRPHRFATDTPSPSELMQVVCEQPPLLPSLVVQDRTRRLQLRGDLDAVLLKALQKDPTQRYHSVAEMADDVQRHLSGEPIRAREKDAGYRIKTRLLHNRGATFAAAFALVALLFLAALIFDSRLRGIVTSFVQRNPISSPDTRQRPVSEQSVAVLPFDVLNDDQQNSYFADGIQETILTDLANVAALKVISRGSVASYRGKTKNEREIGQTLGVAYVLEGTVQKAGDRVRLNTQLIDTRTMTQVWAQQYDRKLDDLFAVQSELAQAIVSQLTGRLSPDEKAAIETRPTNDMQAYDLYLRARESFFQNNLPNAIHLAEGAVTRDPRFVLAHCLLAEIHLYAYRFSRNFDRARLESAKREAETALQLAPKLPQSHLAKAQYYYYGLHDYAQTERELRVAPSSHPDRGFLDLAALTERRLGHWNDAIRDGEKAAELDPPNPYTINELVESYLAVRRYGDAEQLADKGINARVTQNGYLWGLKSQSLLARGRTEEARAVLENAPEEMTRLYRAVTVAMVSRDFDRAAKLLENATPAEKETDAHALFYGMIARAQGNAAKAHSLFQVARDRTARKLKETADDPELISNLALIDAALGLKEQAISEAKRAVDLCPIARDAVDGPGYATMLAAVYAWTGEVDQAINELQKIVRVPRGPDSIDLRFGTFWDDIRSDRRFDELVAQAALPPIYE